MAAEETPEVFEQAEDPNGRTRMDRPLTPAEAQAQDAENRARLEAGRTGRFEPFLSGEEKQARARRGTRAR